jgi:hypothetical protein
LSTNIYQEYLSGVAIPDACFDRDVGAEEKRIFQANPSPTSRTTNSAISPADPPTPKVSKK